MKNAQPAKDKNCPVPVPNKHTESSPFTASLLELTPIDCRSTPPTHCFELPKQYNSPSPLHTRSQPTKAAQKLDFQAIGDSLTHFSFLPAHPHKKRPRPPAELSCSCRRSKCLKFYCDCFAVGNYCAGCNCTGCYNLSDGNVLRKEAVASTLDKNPDAFRPKIRDQTVHSKGCQCEKSECLKRYCECYQGGVVCAVACKCLNCRNRPDLVLE